MPGIREYTGLRPGRRTSLRAPIALCALVPSLALAGLWGFTAPQLAGDWAQLREDVAQVRSTAVPLQALLAELANERRETLTWLAASGSSRSALDDQRRQTDSAINRYRAASASGGAKGRAFDRALGKLARQRESVDKRDRGSETTAYRYYTDTAALGLDRFQEVSRVGDGDLAPGVAAVAALDRASEMLSREDALLSSALASGRSSLTGTAREDFNQSVTSQRYVRSVLDTRRLPGGGPAAYDRTTSGPQWSAIVSVEDALAKRSDVPPRAGEWRAAVDGAGGSLRRTSEDALDRLADDGSDRAVDLLLPLTAGSTAALAAIVVSLVLAQRLSRSLLRRLAGLGGTSRELARSRLAEVAERLRLGQRVDPVQEVPEPQFGADELADAVSAVIDAHRTAVATMARQAQMREGTRTVLLSLAARTQALIHRQISMLDEMERKHEDPDLLKELFEVDHLSTRLRRHAENLVILGGDLPARQWRKGVPLVNVLRSGVSETEKYTRVTVQQPLPRVSIAGRAVADIVHLVAELVENGTNFSPPTMQVHVRAEEVQAGLAIEVEDRGLGMPEGEYERLNGLLAAPPDFDATTLGEDPRLGCYVVSRLANRHGIRVSLRRSPYGGTLAIVLLPTSLLDDSVPARVSGLPTGKAERSGRGAATGAPAAPPVPPPAIATPATQPPVDDDHDRFAFPDPYVGGEPADAHQVPGLAHPEPELGTEPGPLYPPGPVEEDPMKDPLSPELTTPSVLPKRVKRANLDPHLREPDDLTEPLEDAARPPEEVSPEQASALMAAIQRAAQRARENDSAADHHPTAERTAEPGPPGQDSTRTASPATKDEQR